MLSIQDKRVDVSLRPSRLSGKEAKKEMEVGAVQNGIFTLIMCASI